MEPALGLRQVSGTRPLTMLVHGLRDEGASFDPVARLLPDLEIVSYDRRGWGADPDWDGVPADLDGHVDDLLAALDGRTASVVGHSWGGNVALAAAIRRPDLIESVGVWETAMPWADWWPAEHADLIRQTIARSARQRPGSPRQVRERALAAAEMSLALRPPFDPDRLMVPCVVGYGTASYPFFADGIRAFGAKVGAEAFGLAGASHMVHRENPAGFASFARRVADLRTASGAALGRGGL
ncbi:alpha/beta hydrolase [Frankia sp. CNm7]|uniref:Alpha/beta hydrolase n=1 Tax=Frankia nepalensis TaxID=1836974 RepID=A0A937RGL0_9ACTN|nr:alpha/beta hydrolase [Frankia nepalensis]MBL7497394.1 alpha/beta hydrolase [Frankia nepalensis]MBL7512097.1 alpha/beta hydrolase [Frankia nepalensis]MBL7524865.1 alpha/beta hydrolase [Frankia nepalensis]MBL7631803.1 alpha/beta hydrolase [Frankia nepalensis]